MKKNFPQKKAVVVENTDLISRQTFVKMAIGGLGVCYAAAVGYPVYRYLGHYVEKAQSGAAISEVLLKDALKLPKGASMIFKFGAKTCILIHHLDDAWVALDAVCTHLGCTVDYEVGKDRIHCACHGGVYNARTGANVSGPPPRPLKKYGVQIVTDGALVTASETPPKEPELVLKDAAKLPMGSAMSFEIKDRPCLLIHHANNEFVALDGTCTHKGCKVKYQPDKNRVFCPCHAGVFDPDNGTVVSGPPPAPLHKFRLKVNNDDVVIFLS